MAGGHSGRKPLGTSFSTTASLAVSPCFRMEKLGSEVAPVFTHSHVVSLVVSSQPSSLVLFPRHAALPGVRW